MQKYKIIRKIGEGAFSNVFLATCTKTSRNVAIKAHKPGFVQDGKNFNLREAVILQKTRHPAIIQFIQTFMEQGQLFMVFEYMEANLYERYLSRHGAKKITEKQIKNVVFSVASALDAIHSLGYFHRDLKPENILATECSIKLADFGLARNFRVEDSLTDYVSTRWYRAPQLLLRMTRYDSGVDVFALGCIMAELYNGKPLFPGNNEKEQLELIVSRIALPSEDSWPQLFQWCRKKGINLNNSPCKSRHKPFIEKSEHKKDPRAEELLQMMLSFNPSQRITATQITSHPYFSDLEDKAVAQKKAEQLGTKKRTLKKMSSSVSLQIHKSRKNILVMAKNDETINTQYFDNFVKVQKNLTAPNQLENCQVDNRQKNIQSEYQTFRRREKMEKAKQNSQSSFGMRKTKIYSVNSKERKMRTQSGHAKIFYEHQSSGITKSIGPPLRFNRFSSSKETSLSGHCFNKNNFYLRKITKDAIQSGNLKKNIETNSHRKTKVCTPTKIKNPPKLVMVKSSFQILSSKNITEIGVSKFPEEYHSKKKNVHGKRSNLKKQQKKEKSSSHPYY